MMGGRPPASGGGRAVQLEEESVQRAWGRNCREASVAGGESVGWEGCRG